MDLDTFMRLIGGAESGGNYNDTNRDSGASGKYQIMPGNWPEWSRAAGLPPGSPMTPQNQELVARHQMQQYYNAFGGNWGAVAAAWYGGPQAGKAYMQNPNASWLMAKQGGGKYPSIDEYVAHILGGKAPSGGGQVSGKGPVAAGGMAQSPVSAISAPAIQQQGLAGALASSQGRSSVQRSMQQDLTRLGVPNYAVAGGQGG